MSLCRDRYNGTYYTHVVLYTRTYKLQYYIFLITHIHRHYYIYVGMIFPEGAEPENRNVPGLIFKQQQK